MLLYNSEYLTVNYLESKKFTHFKFNEPANNLSLNLLKVEFIHFLDKTVNRKAKVVLFDTENIIKIVDIYLVEWFYNAILPSVISKDFYKIAWFYKDNNFDIFNNISLPKQVFFDKVSDAVRWLNV